MGYRTNREAKANWNRFTDTFRQRLEVAGITEMAFDSEESWMYFVDHVYLDGSPDLLNLESWREADLAALLPIFEEIDSVGFYAGEGSGVLAFLRDRVKK